MKILFISHEATLTGAPLVLLNLVGWFKKHTEVALSLIHLKDGSRYADFEKIVSDVWVKPSFPKKSKSFFLAKALLAKIGINIKTALELYEDQLLEKSPDLLYCNTVACVLEGIHLKRKLKKAKLVIHVHELPIIIDSILPTLGDYVNEIDGFIAASELVKQSLVSKFQVPEHKIEVVYEFVAPIEGISNVTEKSKVFKVGASGYVHWRKGYDVFILIAREFIRKYPHEEIVFEWVGALDNLHKSIVDSDLEKLNLSDYVFFTGETNQPLQKFNDFDVFLMVSREDPFPLVCIEVAQLGKPIICFDKGTGIVEMISSGGGKVVPYMDISATAEAIFDYYTNRAKYELDAAQIKMCSKEYGSEVQVPKILNYLNKIVCH